MAVILWTREEIPHEVCIGDMVVCSVDSCTVIAPEGVSCSTCGNGGKYWPKKDYTMLGGFVRGENPNNRSPNECSHVECHYYNVSMLDVELAKKAYENTP